MENLDPKKAFQKCDIFCKNVRVMISILHNELKFHNELKEADIVPIYKKKSKLS